MSTTGNPRRRRSVPMILAAAAATALSTGAMAQEVKPSPQQFQVETKPIPGAQPLLGSGTGPLRFDALAHDWGRVMDSETLNHEFKFTNITDRTVTIQNVTATCGCTVPQLTKRIYAPGETGEIKVQFNPTNRRGAQSKQVTVTFADEGVPPMRLDLSSHVLPMLWVEPNRVLFQDVYKGVGGTQRVVVTARNPDFQITSMEGMEQGFTARVVETAEAQDEGDTVRKITLEIELDKATKIGTHNTQLVFKSNEPKWPEFKIMGTAMVVGELKADPPSAIIRTQQPNTPFESMAIIETRNSKAFDITDVDWTVEGGQDLNLVVDWEDYASVRGRPTYLLKLSGVTPAVSGTIRATITVKANIEGMEAEEIPVVLWGTVRGADAPRVMPQTATEIPGVKPTTMPSPGISPSSIAPQKPGSK